MIIILNVERCGCRKNSIQIRCPQFAQLIKPIKPSLINYWISIFAQFIILYDLTYVLNRF